MPERVKSNRHEADGHARASADLAELWRRIGFSILISNTDDHLRNHGFLRRSTGGWSLAPAFDLNPDPSPGPKLLRTPIDVGRDEAKLEALLAVAPYFRLDDQQAREIVAELSAATGCWEDVAAEYGLDGSAIERMSSAFVHDESAAASELATREAS
ncbi:MAG TPA: HipA domain-containing protein [Solirubrobacteraceae bacterium]|nr:HipA domain-containing protein [Solirubrobacteraceae bacterium]